VRIILSYASEFDQGEGVHYCRVLRRLGHDVRELNVASSAHGTGSPGRLVLGYPAATRIEDFFEEDWKPDLYLYIEPLGLIPLGLENSAIPTACVICDVHRDLPSRQKLARLFDHVFLYQCNYLQYFTEHEQGAVQWFPCSCDVEFFKDLHLERDLDIAFIGKLPTSGTGSERKRILDFLRTKYRVNEARYYLQKEISDVYSRAKIVLNLPLGDDLNFRFFEALSCGALLLTRRVANGQEKLFKEDVHFAAFDTEEELFAKVDFYLRNEKARQIIAAAGHEEVVARHNLALRVNELLASVASGPRSSAPVRRLGKRQVLSTYASTYERAGRIEAILKLAADNRSHRFARVELVGRAFKTFMRRAFRGW